MARILVIFLSGLLVSSISYNLDKSSYIYICKNCTAELTITSSPNSGYIWYLYSEDDSKVLISDIDGEYISYNNGTAYQIFQAYCTTKSTIGSIIDLTLILKQPWQEDPTIINFVTVEVTASTS